MLSLRFLYPAPTAKKAPPSRNRESGAFYVVVRLCCAQTQALAWEAATAQATVMPTMGLLPAPMRPIIST